MIMPRILIFSPYRLWTIHTVYEETMAKACQVRGASVEYLLCDGLPECDQHWDSKASAPRPSDLCQRCKVAAKTSLVNLDFPYQWLTAFVSDVERTKASAWAQSLTPAELPEASFEATAIGKLVFSSMVSYFRRYPLDLSNGHVVSVYRGFLISGALVATALRNYLKTNAIEAAILFNGRQSITRVAFEIFREHGIRVLTHERAEYKRGHINVKPNAHCMSPEPFAALWRMWGKVPLNRKALDLAFKWLVQRRYGANLAWIPFNKAFTHNSALRAKLNLSQDKHLWVLFTSSSDEVAGDPLMQGPYESQIGWVRDVVQWVGLRDDVQLVIKVHPNLGGNDYIGKSVDELSVYEDLKAALPPNVRIVMPSDLVNAYSLAEESDAGLTFGSTIGLEMAMLGKPVLLASKALYGNCSKILTVSSRETLPALLEKCLYAVPDREIQREAFRLAYYYIFAFEMPFAAVQVVSLYEAKSNYAHLDDLTIGNDDSLNKICDFLLRGRPLFDCPTLDERSRTTADEDEFFEELGNSPEYLKDPRYERWLKLKSLGHSTGDLIRRLPFGTGDRLLDLGRRGWHSILMRMETGDPVSPRRR
jgi:hypothetical protein